MTFFTGLQTARGADPILPSPPDSFAYAVNQLKQDRERAIVRAANPALQRPGLSIVISGGGPAGLFRGIFALTHGHNTTILEKRSDSEGGRENTVMLTKRAYTLLRNWGVYQYLLEQGLIFPVKDDTFNVRLKDLERAMKGVIAALTQESIIQYDSQLEQILSNGDNKADLIYSKLGQHIQIKAVDLLVIAEGAHSRTCADLLGQRRISMLPSLLGLTTICKDNRSQTSGVNTYVRLAGNVCNYMFSLCSSLIQKEHFLNPNRRIALALTLATPNQNSVSCALSQEETEEMHRILQAFRTAKAELEMAKAQNGTPAQLSFLEERCAETKTQKEAYLNHRMAQAFGWSQTVNVVRSIRREAKLHPAPWLPMGHVSIIESGPDRADAFSGRVGNTVYLLAGDTVATVDPTTGNGCNTAIETLGTFATAITQLASRQTFSTATLLETYNNACAESVRKNHLASVTMRTSYRPDATALPLLQDPSESDSSSEASFDSCDEEYFDTSTGLESRA